MSNVSLIDVALLLAAAAVAAPLAKFLRIGTVLGYLLAGILLGPYGVGQVFSLYESQEILHFAEFGVVLLLFLIGLELRPARLWALRNTIVGMGGAQVGLTAVLLGLCGVLYGWTVPVALFAGLALALSSTAFALQVLEENGELTARHGRLAFSVLLFQDLAAIPLIALVPLFAVNSGAKAKMEWTAAVLAIVIIVGVVVVGRLVLHQFLQLVATTRVKEAMTAAALLTVVGVSAAMQTAGISASLGAFLAGALLADSAYRHQLEADIQPFEGLLLGLFFTAVGMSLNLYLLLQQPLLIAAMAAVLLIIKSAVLYGLGRWQKLNSWASRRLALSISQGGEFAFVLLAAGVGAGVMGANEASLLAVVVTLSMAATPLMLLMDSMFGKKPQRKPKAFDQPPEGDKHVIIAGFGRFGQITARILRAKRIPFTPLDINPEQIELVKRFGSEAFYGDASRLEILQAARADKACAFVLAIDDMETSLRTAEVVRREYPDLPIYARARDRNHVHHLMDLGVRVIRRETLLSALDLSRELLRGLGLTERDVKFAVETFAKDDERRLVEDYKHYTDVQKVQERARTNAENLAKLFDEDAREQSRAMEASTADGA